MGYKLHQFLRQTVLKPSAPDKVIVVTDHLINVLIDGLLFTGRLKPERNHFFQQVRIPQPGHKHGDVINRYIPVVFPCLLEELVVILKLIAAQPQGIPCFSLVIQELQVIHYLRDRSSLVISQIVSGLPVRGCTCHSVHRLCSFLQNAQPTIHCSLVKSISPPAYLYSTSGTSGTWGTDHEFLLTPM